MMKRIKHFQEWVKPNINVARKSRLNLIRLKIVALELGYQYKPQFK